ncbi:uncharacterized protein LOC112574795 isoform X6 [Pomacea canaliculata]|uniref:uncharacterized protein LOC112574795 isoform X5 n=1 Tax=Pomacea canaliculata TaxID=400727 RepID=UPI000D72E4F1|nr:uncharacterized protein LOC112574795 isoform X5 [Pomacea canaliculata]XP_025111874.1 uncharacterized protein LOC112574795 isoform X6 [Pomacea canaliculata]
MSVTHLMAQAARSVVVLFFIFALFTAQAQTGNTVTCDVPSVEPLANTSVTCHFPENVNQTRRIVTVSFYKGAQYTVSNENDILECWWLSGKMDCDVKRGYKFNRIISHELTLEIPRVSTKQIGGYVCKLSNMNPKDVKYCELKIKLEGKTMCDVPSVPLNSRTSLTCYFPEDLSKNTADFSVYHQSTSSDSVDVISCKRMGDHWSCDRIRGYEFDQTVTNHLTVGIPTAQEDQEGSYSCHYTSSSPVRYENCSLTLTTVTSFCNISSAVETEPASLTCTFNVDVNATKQNFSLVRIGGADNKGVDIVTCTWLKDQLKCTTAPGYEVNNTVTDRLVIRVPRASRDHTGTYACHVNGSKANGFQSCEFILKPVTSFCNISSIKETKPASLTCTFNVDVNATKSNLSLVRLGGDESNGNVYSCVDIVACTWLQDQLKCTTAPGYEVNNLVTDRLVIRVLQASRDHTGTYTCHVTGSSMDGFKSCDFILIPDVPAVVLTVAIAVLVLFPVSLVIIFLVFECKQRKHVAIEEQIPLISRAELQIRAKQEEEFWEKWVEAAFPDLDSSVYFLPPVHVSRVPTTQESVAGQTVLVLQSSPQTDESNQTATTAVEDSDVRHDAAMQRVLLCLETMFKENREVLVGVSQLLFDDYLRDSRYADVARRLPLPARYPSDLGQEWKPGDIDVLLIHRQHGLVICKVKVFGGNVNEQNMSEKERTEKTHTEIKNNLQEAIKQLDRPGVTVSHLASDVAPGLRVTKTIALPNLTVSQLQQVLDNDRELTQDLCRCLGSSDPADITGVCLCCDQLSDPKTPWDVSSHVLKNLGEWWTRRVAVSGPDSHMTRHVYKTLVARFCGPATTVSVPCTCPPRVSVKTLGQAVWWTGECYML